MSDGVQEVVFIEAARSDPQAFDTLYQRYVHRIYRYALARLHHAEEAADATQQTFLRAWQSLDHYRVGSSFAAWLFGIARHVISTMQSHQSATVSWDEVPEDAHPWSHTGNPEALVLFHESQTSIQQLLSRLDPHKQELLALYRDDALTIPEIAGILGKTPEAVRKQITRTLKILREQYHAANR